MKAGDIPRPSGCITARAPYERIEPVAESSATSTRDRRARGRCRPGGLDGFHPLEKALWATGTLEDTAPLADQLVQDVQLLDEQVATVKLEAAQVANGSVELLGEVSKSKITGEEERYSHIDLVDVEANVAGAKAGFDAVRPIVVEEGPSGWRGRSTTGSWR